ncbi:DUF2971 domain-containing protein [Methylomonas fluvii]|uniref:DUF2971 domain-containing protein n=1 Tax=Methylomonas fluvii TaxID=1854564 RepID=A0ABR9DJ03_9GAMM|nr:DUF2971 domain-containing protein [Methylomonas fluvii]MBD9363089.1 DUF2971 domain-containing protein [Methylomonas fluvii]
MPAETDHPCFLPPEDKSVKIWRYMDFTKFVSLLETESLFLSRVDKFEDPYEGATSHANAIMRPYLYGEKGIPKEALQQLSKFTKWTRSWTYVNCWHMNNTESAAMWKLYAQTNEAVAIQSTYTKLHDNLAKDTYVGVVHYIDYDKDWLPEGNGFWPYVHKRQSFEHEKELRVLIQDLPSLEEPDKGLDYSLVNNEFGKSIKVDLKKLIENVYVSPVAPKWFFEVVAGVAKRYGCDFEVKQSNLAKEPVF